MCTSPLVFLLDGLSHYIGLLVSVYLFICLSVRLHDYLYLHLLLKHAGRQSGGHEDRQVDRQKESAWVLAFLHYKRQLKGKNKISKI